MTASFLPSLLQAAPAAAPAPARAVEPGVLDLSRWLPPVASAEASQIDAVFTFIFAVCAIFFLIIVFLTLLFVIRYRERRWWKEQPSPTHNTRLELLWSGIPLLLVFVMFGLSTATYGRMGERPAGQKPFEIQVTARKWSWWFDHPGGRGSDELHVIQGKPVELTMSGQDVLHSLYVPAFRLKQDVVPGRFTKLAFTPVQPGTFPLYCAEYCGTNHSRMTTFVVVHPDRAAYDEWLRSSDDSGLPLVEVGRRLFC